MESTTLARLTEVEGRNVGVALKGGVRIDDCQLVALPIRGGTSFWLFSNGRDMMIPADDVLDVWEIVPG